MTYIPIKKSYLPIENKIYFITLNVSSYKYHNTLLEGY